MSTCKYVADPVREQTVRKPNGTYNRVPGPNIPGSILREWLQITTENRLGVAPKDNISVIIGPEVPCSVDKCTITQTRSRPRSTLRKRTVEYLRLTGGETLRYELRKNRRVKLSVV